MLRCILFGRLHEILSLAWSLSDFSSRRGCELAKRFSGQSRNDVIRRCLTLSRYDVSGCRALVLPSLRFVRRLALLLSTQRIAVVVGFPFTASIESPYASEALGFSLAGNGRTSTAPSRPERGSFAHCKAGILQWPTNPLSRFGPVT